LDGCAPGSAVVTCNDNSCGTSSSVVLNATAAQTYYIVIGGSSAGAVLPSPLTVTVTPPPTPDCNAAPAVAFGSSSFTNVAFTGNQTVGTNATGTTTSIIYNTAWSKFTPAVTGAYTFSLCGSAPCVLVRELWRPLPTTMTTAHAPPVALATTRVVSTPRTRAFHSRKNSWRVRPTTWWLVVSALPPVR
jgi:hypothetical protein